MHKLGIVVSSEKLILVHAVDDGSDKLALISDDTWLLQSGPRPDAYVVIHKRLAQYVAEHKIDEVVVKASALSLKGTKKGHLQAAELRGVVLASAASATSAREVLMENMSKNYGSRKADEYLADDGFWTNHTTGADLRKGSREATFILLQSKK
jgi:hypothetical protein